MPSSVKSLSLSEMDISDLEPEMFDDKDEFSRIFGEPSIGLVLKMDIRGQTIVKRCVEGSSADGRGIPPGCRVAKINATELEPDAYTLMQVQQLLRDTERPLKVYFQQTHDSSAFLMRVWSKAKMKRLAKDNLSHEKKTERERKETDGLGDILKKSGFKYHSALQDHREKLYTDREKEWAAEDFLKMAMRGSAGAISLPELRGAVQRAATNGVSESLIEEARELVEKIRKEREEKMRREVMMPADPALEYERSLPTPEEEMEKERKEMEKKAAERRVLEKLRQEKLAEMRARRELEKEQRAAAQAAEAEREATAKAAAEDVLRVAIRGRASVAELQTAMDAAAGAGVTNEALLAEAEAAHVAAAGDAAEERAAAAQAAIEAAQERQAARERAAADYIEKRAAMDKEAAEQEAAELASYGSSVAAATSSGGGVEQETAQAAKLAEHARKVAAEAAETDAKIAAAKAEAKAAKAAAAMEKRKTEEKKDFPVPNQAATAGSGPAKATRTKGVPEKKDFPAPGHFDRGQKLGGSGRNDTPQGSSVDGGSDGEIDDIDDFSYSSPNKKASVEPLSLKPKLYSQADLRRQDELAEKAVKGEGDAAATPAESPRPSVKPTTPYRAGCPPPSGGSSQPVDVADDERPPALSPGA
jgi:hypothetical protein